MVLKRSIERVAAALVAAAGTLAGAAQSADYETEVRPILSARCYSCHGATQQKAGLRLDTAAAALRGGRSGSPIRPGDAAQSLLIRAVRGTAAGLERMPYKRPALEAREIAVLTRWIDAGAPVPEREEARTEADRGGHWAFRVPQSPDPPATRRGDWARSPVDQFILAALEREGLAPSLEADRATLIRRLSLDLLGVPPSIEEIDAFVSDDREDAYKQLVERLLRSPRYGERWARHWLDLARYADSNGYSVDNARSIWPYRDWVIHALNEDMPFDQFSLEQLAGDLLPEATLAQRVATGFHRNTQINQEGGIDPEQFRVDAVVDRVNTTGVVWLGLTVGCAQCHEHKFDPISQKEYYQLFAFFNDADEPALDVGAPEELERLKETRAARRELERRVKSKVLDDAKRERIRKRIDALKREEAAVPKTLVLRERGRPRDTRLMIKGDFTRPGDSVAPGVPAALHPLAVEGRANRLDLARWLFQPDNPLTSRVTVNRVWQRYFGSGLVETENDFGVQGAPPSHPELLDWLALRFQQGGWRLKDLHRLIVHSSTYCQESRWRADLAAVDPANRLLGRQSRHRLEAEIVRDVALTASGLLSDAVGGPGVYPAQPDGVMDLGQRRRVWRPSQGSDRYRRGLYTFFWRATPNPALRVFDAPDAFSACTRRARSNTPLQALTLLNDPSFVELAVGLARRALRQEGGDPERIRRAFRWCATRAPEEAEVARLLDLLESMRRSFATTPDDAAALGDAGSADSDSAEELAAWTAVARVLLNLDETISRP